MNYEYFSHDYRARADSKLICLFMKHGLKGIGAYWCIIEMLYENNGYIMQTECERIAFELRTEFDFIKSIISDFGLFTSDKKTFFSESVLKRLLLRKEKSISASNSAKARWNNANALQTHDKRNAIKESKVKESKVNNIIYPAEISESKIGNFEVWFQYKKDIKDYYKSQKSIETLFKKYKNYSDTEFEEIVMNSIANGWKGLFEVKKVNGNKPKSTVSSRNAERMRETLREIEIEKLKTLSNE